MVMMNGNRPQELACMLDMPTDQTGQNMDIIILNIHRQHNSNVFIEDIPLCLY